MTMLDTEVIPIGAQKRLPVSPNSDYCISSHVLSQTSTPTSRVERVAGLSYPEGTRPESISSRPVEAGKRRIPSGLPRIGNSHRFLPSRLSIPAFKRPLHFLSTKKPPPCRLREDPLVPVAARHRSVRSYPFFFFARSRSCNISLRRLSSPSTARISAVGHAPQRLDQKWLQRPAARHTELPSSNTAYYFGLWILEACTSCRPILFIDSVSVDSYRPESSVLLCATAAICATSAFRATTYASSFGPFTYTSRGPGLAALQTASQLLRYGGSSITYQSYQTTSKRRP
ncbi:hypothetical protein JMJ77_0006894 [Colletotrichum scovillei]|uniref:Uncharacterized protein n=1 Tax=Colletotrichum scovillei TaxID=1209932 RepID=A0A9P7UJW8_9PEZI|nr:hypothetical protein JMJ77_0006894 [Colletotrichum scovillei]KAG7078140.1 hypothetical protein JMJ76_0015375 [Colletotrichum scovillei]KAG7085250.1 hypothetical protein JMJ78_0010675 [Colletotrichum scovillei]